MDAQTLDDLDPVAVLEGEALWPISESLFQIIIAWVCAYVWILDIELKRKYPFDFNEVQRDVLARSRALRLEPVVDGTIKPRQVGMTVFLCALIIAIIVHVPGITVAWVNGSEDQAGRVLTKFREIWLSVLNAPNLPEVKLDNAKRFVLENGSKIEWELAGKTPEAAKDTGRADTIHLAIYCEMATWPYAENTLKAIEPAVTSTKGAIFIDSTPSEYEDSGEAYAIYIQDILDGRKRGEVLFYPWYHRHDYQLDTPALPPYTLEELELMIEHGLNLRQIAWRRQMMADSTIGPVFQWIYPEDLLGALEPKGTKAFPAAVIRELRMKSRYNQWAIPVSRDVLRSLVPKDAGDARTLLLDPKYTRVYRLKNKIPHLKPRRRSRNGAPSIAQAMGLLLNASSRDAPHFAGVDSSNGGEGSDMQAVAALDIKGFCCLEMEVCVRLAIFASMIAIAARHFYPGLGVLVETNAPGGEVCARYLQEVQAMQTIREKGASPILATVTPNVEKIHIGRSARVELETIFVETLGTISPVQSAATAGEMLAWDPVLKKARPGSRDNLLDAHALGHMLRLDYVSRLVSQFDDEALGYGLRDQSDKYPY